MSKFSALCLSGAFVFAASLASTETVKLSNVPKTGWSGPPILTEELVEQALHQAPDLSEVAFRNLGEARLVNSAIGQGGERTEAISADPFSQEFCSPFEYRSNCHLYSHKVMLSPRGGASGYCNPPFINYAIERPILTLGDATFNSNHGLFGYLDYKYTLSEGTVISDNFFIGYSIGQECEGAYIAVFDTYLRGFEFPLFRNVMHLGPGGSAGSLASRFSDEENPLMSPSSREVIKKCRKDTQLGMACFIQAFRADRTGKPPYQTMKEVAAAYGKDLTLAAKRFAQRRELAYANGPGERDVLIALRIHLDKKKKKVFRQSGSCDKDYVGNSPERVFRCAIWLTSQINREVGLQVETVSVSGCRSVTKAHMHNPEWLCTYQAKLKSDLKNGMIDFLMEAQELGPSAYGLFSFRGMKWEFVEAYDSCIETSNGFECS